MHRGLVGCPIVLQVVGQVWGVNGWRQFQVCLVCQRKAGGDTGGIWLLVESGWDMYGISMCRRFMCVFSVYRLLIENGRGTFCLRWR